MRLSKSDRHALALLQEVKALKESTDREIMAWIISRVVPRASTNLQAFLDGAGGFVLVDEHRRKRPAPKKTKKRRR